jgi:CDGSH-type Zn-finger protein
VTGVQCERDPHFEIVEPDGVPVPTRRRTVALCRCALSSLKPFRDGSHKVTGFRTDS